MNCDERIALDRKCGMLSINFNVYGNMINLVLEITFQPIRSRLPHSSAATCPRCWNYSRTHRCMLVWHPRRHLCQRCHGRPAMFYTGTTAGA